MWGIWWRNGHLNRVLYKYFVFPFQTVSSATFPTTTPNVHEKPDEPSHYQKLRTELWLTSDTKFQC